MNWKKELKETNWLYVFVVIGLIAMMIKVIIDKDVLQPLPIHIQYLTTIAMLYLLVRTILK